MIWNNETRIGTAGGALLSTVLNLSSYDLMQTIVCAAIGASVSYMVTLLLKKLLR